MTVSTVLLVVLTMMGSTVLMDVVDGKRLRYGHHDALFVARCEARCWSWISSDKSSCVKSCLLKGVEKPGTCPDGAVSAFELACLNACRQDTECPGLTKCCPHSCGITCQQPNDLSFATGVPNIPRDLKITEGRRKRTVYLEWKPGETSHPDKNRIILYLIEERHHSGRNFVEKRLTEWVPCARSAKSSQILKNFVKPGRWYQFRVSAVNENGTKGYCESPIPFSVSISPKPPKAPLNVTVGPLWTSNGTLNAELRWSPPPSDLPIQRYKVFWSRRLHGATALDSVLVRQQAVSRDQTQFSLHNLQPNSLYFLQVQALAQFGKDRLKGEKSGLVLNTTDYTNITDNVITINVSPKSSIEDLKLQKLFWSQNDLRARIIWKANDDKSGPVKYTVSWWTGPCHQNYKTYSECKLAATTKATHFDLYDLQFNRRYRVSIRGVSAEGMKSIQDTSVNFTTPTCNLFKLKYNKKIKCTH